MYKMPDDLTSVASLEKVKHVTVSAVYCAGIVSIQP